MKKIRKMNVIENVGFLLRGFTREECMKHGHIEFYETEDQKGFIVENKTISIVSIVPGSRDDILEIHQGLADGTGDFEIAVSIATNSSLSFRDAGVLALAMLRLVWVKDSDTPTILHDDAMGMLQRVGLKAEGWHQ